jgi:hypothetical protein
MKKEPKAYKLIKQQGHSKLVEFTEGDRPKRAILPVGEDNLEMSIPHGFPFAEALKPHVCEGMAERIEAELHKVGIWTPADIQRNPGAAQGAVLSAYGVDYAILLQLAKQFKEV